MPTAEVAASSGTSVLCIRCHESAGHMVVCVVTGQMVGDRRSPGATILGVATIYLLRQPSFLVSPTGREHLDGSWTVYEMAGSVHPDGFLFEGFRFAPPEALRPRASCCGSAITHLRCGFPCASCCGSGKRSKCDVAAFRACLQSRRRQHERRC